MKKRGLSLVLCLILCLGLFPGMALAQTDTDEPVLLAEEPALLVMEEAEEAPVDEASAEEVPVEEPPTEEIPADDAPAAEEESVAPAVTLVAADGSGESGDEPTNPEGDNNASGGPLGPQPAATDFTVTFNIVAPEGTDITDAIVRKDKAENGDIIDFAGSPSYSHGDSALVNAGEWALFGYKEIEGLYASWSGSTMHNGLYAVADHISNGSTTLTLTYSTENNPSGGPSNPNGNASDEPIIPDNDNNTSDEPIIPDGDNNASGEPTGEMDYAEYYDILTGSADSVSTHSAVVSATYWAPYSEEVNSCEFEIYYGVSANEINTLCLAPVDGGEFDPTGTEGKSQTRTLYALHAGTTYYYRAVLQVPEGAVLPEGVTATEVDGKYFIYGETKSFNTTSGSDTAFALQAPAGSPSAWTECTVSPRLPSMADADANGCVMVPFTVDTDGAYRVSMEVTEPTDTTPYQGTHARDHQLSACICQQFSPGHRSTENMFALQVFFNTMPNDSEFTSAILNLKAGVNYYFLVDNDGADWTVKFEYAVMDNTKVEYDVHVSNIDYTFDSRPQRQMLQVDYETESPNTLQASTRAVYDLASNYSSYDEFLSADFEDIPYSAGIASGEMGAESGTLYHTMNYCVEGQKYYYKLLFEGLEYTTETIARYTSTHSGEFIADYAVDRLLAMGENHDSHGNASLASVENFMHAFTPETDGLYQFTFNKEADTFDLYSDEGKLLVEGLAGSRQDANGNTVCVWTSFQAELEAGETYYVFFCLGPDAVVPIVTVSRLNGKTDMDESHVQTENSCKESLSQNLGLLLNDLTKSNGEDVPLPDYIICTDAEEEAALRGAIEDGALLAPTMTGTALEPEELDEEFREALTTAADQACGGEATELSTVDLSVLITLDSESVGRITELDEAITFYMVIPENQREVLTGKTIRIFRCHEKDGQNEISVIKEFVYQGEARIPFQSHQFSVFSAFVDGIVEVTPPEDVKPDGTTPEDAAPEKESSTVHTIPPTVDSRQPILWALALVSLSAAMSVLLLGKKRRS